MYKIVRKDKSPDAYEIKIFTKIEKELETLQQAIRIYFKDIRMKIEIEKCSILVMKKAKRETIEGIELPIK